MKNLFKLSVAAAVSALCAGAMAQSIDNPSFASGLTTSEVNNNWTDYNNSTVPISVAGGVASLNSGAIMYQSLDGLTAGQTYQISFWATGSGFLDVSDDRNTSTGGFALTNGSVGLGETDAAFDASLSGWSGWMTSPNVFRINTTIEGLKQYSFSFTASDATEYLWVKGFTGVGGSSANLRVDDFAISAVTTAVPEPETYAMMLASLGAMGLMSRRRRAK